MIYGDIPFECDEDIVNCKLDFYKFQKTNFQFNNGGHNVRFNPDVNDLITKCLKIDVKERIKMEDILNHRWLVNSINSAPIV